MSFPKEPESMSECMYFSNRRLTIDKGKALAWIPRKICPKCKEGLMKKPKKTATNYVCPKCGYEESVKELEEEAIVYIKYECPFCGHKGEATTPYVRKTLYGKKAFVFLCESCKEKIGIYKKMNIPDKFLEKVEAANK